MKLNKVAFSIGFALSILLSSGCKQDVPYADGEVASESADISSDSVTMINAASMNIDDYGTAWYETIPDVDFNNIKVDLFAPSLDVDVLSILSSSATPGALVNNDALSKVWIDYTADATHVMCTETYSALQEANLLDPSLISTINDKYMGTVASLTDSDDKTCEYWFTLSAKDNTGREKRLYWRIGKSLTGEPTAYFMCYPNLLVTGELAYYLTALYNNGYGVIDLNQIVREYYGLLSDANSAAIYDKNVKTFSFILD